MFSSSVIATALVLAAPTAQDRVTASHFLVPGYSTVAYADLAAMRERGIWSDVEVSALRIAFDGIERGLGVPLDDLDRLTMVAHVPERKGGAGPADPQHVLVLEGNTALAAPESYRASRWRERRIGSYDVRVRSRQGAEVFCRPRSDMHVVGDLALLEPSLAGERQPARPSADVLSLLSGRDPELAYLVVDLRAPGMGDEVLERGLRNVLDVEWPKDDRPTFLALRLLATGPEHDPHLVVEAVMRHARGEHGLAATRAGFEDFVAHLRKRQELLMFRRLLGAIELDEHGPDLRARLDLGRSRDAAGNLVLLALPLWSGGGRAR